MPDHFAHPRALHAGPRLALLAVAAGLFAPTARGQCQIARVEAADKQTGDQFGQDLSFAGGVLVVGAHFKPGPTGPLTGAAYVYESGPGGFVQTAKLLASDIKSNDRFGYSVATDGQTIAVGSRYKDDLGYGTGAVYLFEKVSGQWTEVQKLLPADPTANKFFGASVDVSGDSLIAGAELDSSVAPGAGSAYVFERQPGGPWIQTAKLTASDAAIDDAFGSEVAIDGGRAVVSAKRDDDKGAQSGSLYVFEKTPGGAWQQTAKLTASDGMPDDRLGHSVAIEGGLIVAGTLLGDGVEPDTGSAYVFEWTGTSWVEAARLVDPAGSFADQFGSEVAIEWPVVAVGAWGYEDSNLSDAGAVVLFRDIAGEWVYAGRAKASDPGSQAALGWSVSLDGGLLFAGARAAGGTGAAYGFDGVADAWSFGSGCAPSPFPPPELLVDGCASAGETVEARLVRLIPGAPGVLLVGLNQTAIPLPGPCTLYVGLSPLVPIPIPGPPSDHLELPGSLPPSAAGAAVALQYFQTDPSAPAGFRASNGAWLPIQ